MKQRVLAIIPARGGSKGIPRKNIKPMLGKPLIAWSIEQAKASGSISKVVVSTEDAEIASVSRKYGAEVIDRPKELASDQASSFDVILHALSHLESKGERFDMFIFLEPTSPLRDVSDIDKSLELLVKNPKANAIVGVAKLEGGHPEFNVIINNEGFIRRPDGSANFKFLRRQELTDVYFFEGSIYASKVDAFRKKKTYYHESTLPYIVPKYKSLEVDEICDFICIEALMKAKREGVKLE